MNRNKTKILFGILTLGLFIYIFVSAGGGLSSVSSELNRVYTRLSQTFTSRNGDIARTLVRQQVVQEESSIIDVVDVVSPAVVSVVIKTVDFDLFSGPLSTESGIGTGFIVSGNGLIVTNSHVVDSEQGEYSVVLKDGTTYEVENIHLDTSTDLAILEISARGLPTVELGDSEALKVGQQAIAIGNALGRFTNTVTVGIVSGVARELTATSGLGGSSTTYEGAIQTDAALNPGNSGGPLLNSAGQVIGINVATTRGADNIGFAIPVNTLKPILESFLAEGRIIRPYMGVSYTMITKEIASLRRLPEGAFVSRVVVDSPARKAGLERGDIIVKFGGKDVAGDNSLSRLISGSKVGDRVDLVIDRSGQQQDLSVTLEEAPQQ
ncbi:MAG: 2-alkenal reductase [candidate division WWE3 bacterium GW2011_GWB1_41_6]|uniref:2-alkenal reductase n=2 Tax=Katanobacteria TaxID=422282 RepID=A0A0G0ZUK7_UNCKA|nr:MAG: 2-alkenal reductase [candidate division WWE3 bacterium GW2011_GWB1_41_6]